MGGREGRREGERMGGRRAQYGRRVEGGGGRRVREEGRFGEGESNNIVGIDGGGKEEVRRCKEGGTEREK